MVTRKTNDPCFQTIFSYDYDLTPSDPGVHTIKLNFMDFLNKKTSCFDSMFDSTLSHHLNIDAQRRFERGKQ